MEKGKAYLHLRFQQKASKLAEKTIFLGSFLIIIERNKW